MSPRYEGKPTTRASSRPELERAVALAGELRASGVAVTLVVHEHKRLDRGIELAALAEQLKAGDIGLEFLTVITTGKKKGRHPSPAIVLRMLREHDAKAAPAVSTIGG